MVGREKGGRSGRAITFFKLFDYIVRTWSGGKYILTVPFFEDFKT